MFFEVTSVITRPNSDGFDKECKEKFFIDCCEFFAEAEAKMLEYYNNENHVIDIKQSKLIEFINKRSDEDEYIYVATIEAIFVLDDASEKRTKYIVGLFAKDIKNATRIVLEYMNQGIDDMELVKISRTKFLEVI